MKLSKGSTICVGFHQILVECEDVYSVSIREVLQEVVHVCVMKMGLGEVCVL